MDEILDTVIVIMTKNKTTGFLEKELGSYKINDEDYDLIVNVFAIEEAEKINVHLKLTVDRDVENWEFDAIYDYYDEENIKAEVTEVFEVEDSYNPTWEMVFDFKDSQEAMENKLEAVIKCHKKELQDVYDVIKDKKDEYNG